MKSENIEEYVQARRSEGLTKIDISLEDDTCGHYVVIKTKETYVFEDEESADRKVDELRQDPGFAGVDKKYKAGKINKAGEITKPETWSVVGKLNK